MAVLYKKPNELECTFIQLAKVHETDESDVSFHAVTVWISHFSQNVNAASTETQWALATYLGCCISILGAYIHIYGVVYLYMGLLCTSYTRT